MIARIVRSAREGTGFLLFALVLSSVVWSAGCSPVVYETSAADYTTTDDYDYLSYYGEWVEVAPYGMVWRPGVVAAWAPFYNGHWVWSNYGWAWVSYEPFGWLVYHYGNWNYDPGLGWFWLPGHRWSPARVEWYTFGDYTAWAPIPPPNVYWPDPWDPHPFHPWVVVDIHDFTRDDVGHHRMMRPVPRGGIPPQAYHKRAPDIDHVEKIMRTTVPKEKIGRQDVDVRRVVAKPSGKFDHNPKPTLQRMVLPPEQKSKMEKNMSKVEKDVVTPRKGAPPTSPQPIEKKKKGDTERKSDTSRERKKG